MSWTSEVLLIALLDFVKFSYHLMKINIVLIYLLRVGVIRSVQCSSRECFELLCLLRLLFSPV